MRTARILPVVALAALLAGCQSPDVGQRCRLPRDPQAADAPTPATISGDYLETGNPACDNLVCVMSPSTPGGRYNDCPGGECGYCSKPCVSDQDCFRSDTGLACRQLVLDPAFLASLTPETRQKYLGDIQFSSYCIVAR